MRFKERWLHYLPAGLILAAIVLAITWFLRPVPFDCFSEMGLEDTVLVTCFTGSDTEQIRLNRERLQPLEELLEAGKLRFVGRTANISWNSGAGEYLYDLYPDGGEPFSLRSDGAVFRSLFLGSWSLGSAEYRLTGCDMAAVEAELQRLLSMTPSA